MRLRYRKTALLSMALFACTGWWFWPRDHVEAQRLLAELRELVEIESRPEHPRAGQPPADGDKQIEVAIMMIAINTTDATADLFGAERGLAFGRVTDQQRAGEAIERLRALEVARVLCKPRVTTDPGQHAWVIYGTEIPVKSPQALGFRHVGPKIAVIPHLGEGGDIVLEVEQQHSRLASTRLVPTPAGAQPDIEWVAAKIAARIAEGETLLIGGLAHKADVTQNLKVPLASKLPGIGSWFNFSWQREIDEELVVLITPRRVEK